MTENTDSQKQAKLNDFLRQMSVRLYDDADIAEEMKTLSSVYTDDFRHGYSQILAILYEVKGETSKTTSESYSLEYLTNNIEVVKDRVRNDEQFKYIKKSVEKLYDHINLEVARFNKLEALQGDQRNLEANFRHVKEEYLNARRAVDELRNEQREESSKLQEAKKQLEEAQRQLSNAKCGLESTVKETEYLKAEVITVIGIFAAIILAFVGGMSFTSNTLTSMYASSIYKVGFISTICGFVVFNTILCLIYFISKITNRDIYAKCNDENCKKDCMNESHDSGCWTISRIRKRLPYIFWVNAVLLLILVIVGLCWFFDIKMMHTVFQKWLWDLN